MTMEPEAFLLPPSGAMPNNPWLPVLVYRGAVPAGTPERADAMEALFGRNGWPAQWRNGIFAYHHYHAEVHEVLGIAAGGTDVLLGGPEGRLIYVAAGDVLVLPAGTGHRNMTPDAKLLTVGAYPPGAVCDVRRDALPTAEVARMRAVPFPASDPVTGSGGALLRLEAEVRPIRPVIASEARRSMPRCICPTAAWIATSLRSSR